MCVCNAETKADVGSLQPLHCETLGASSIEIAKPLASSLCTAVFDRTLLFGADYPALWLPSECYPVLSLRDTVSTSLLSQIVTSISFVK